MIVLDLMCSKDHRFEGWFASHADFEKQHETKLLNCPVCGAHEVRKLPSAPYVQRSSSSRKDVEPAAPAEVAPTATDVQGMPEHAKILSQLIDKLRQSAAQSEDVGKDFPQEARRIHHGDAEERSIKGSASAAELESLLEEGINVLPIPPAKEDLH